MKRRSSSPTSTAAAPRRPSTSWRLAAVPVALAVLTVSACGGGDDDSSSSSTTTTLPVSTTTTVAATTTVASSITTTTVAQAPDLVTEGATIIVANSSGINGAAGRMTDALALEGFTMGEATNGTEGQLNVTKIYFDPANDAAQDVAESVRIALGGGDIQLFEMGVPAPVESGDIGDASIVVAMGNDVADKSLDELQGLVPASTTEDESTTTTEAG